MTDASRVTLASVAAEAGVSLTTMSKVLNGRTDVAPATRARLEEHLRRSGYRRRGSGRRNPSVELVLRELRAPLSLEVIDGVREAAAASGLALTLTVVGDQQADGDGLWLDAVLRRRPTGVIVVSYSIDADATAKLRLRDIPVVVVEPVDVVAPGIPVVGVAHWSAGVAATRHLIELGHRRIAAISGPREMARSHARLDGFRSAMRLAGIPVDPTLTGFGGLDAETGARAATEFLSLPDPPTAIIAAGELQAPGVLKAARTIGVRVPTDLSLVGYDDQPISTSSSPSLTAIHQPMREVGVEAARLVLRHGHDPEVWSARVDLAATLVVRDSTSSPKAR